MEKKVIKYVRHYDDGSSDFIEGTFADNFTENLDIASGFAVSRTYLQFNPVIWTHLPPDGILWNEETIKDWIQQKQDYMKSINENLTPIQKFVKEENELEKTEGKMFDDGVELPAIVKDLEGVFVREAMDMLEEYNLKLCVVKRDGIPLFKTPNLNHNRVNVETENSVITKVQGLG